MGGGNEGQLQSNNNKEKEKKTSSETIFQHRIMLTFLVPNSLHQLSLKLMKYSRNVILNLIHHSEIFPVPLPKLLVLCLS